MLRTNPNQACIDACQNCATACEYAVTLALERHPDAVAPIRDCATLCEVAIKLMSRNSVHAPRLCSVVADAAAAAADACETVDHDHFRTCADACRRCMRFCCSERPDGGSLGGRIGATGGATVGAY